MSEGGLKFDRKIYRYTLVIVQVRTYVVGYHIIRIEMDYPDDCRSLEFFEDKNNNL